MVFADLFFLFAFLPAFAICYLIAGLAKGNTLKNGVLVLFSLIFYAWGEPVYVVLLVLCALLNWLFGRGIDRKGRGRTFWLVVGLIGNLAILGTFKYLGFFADLLGRFGVPLQVPEIALPIGISFYTFQSISYLVDVYRRESPAQRRFWDLLLYISMFPQLIAGPIVRYGTIAKEIHTRKVRWEDFSEGGFRFLVGLGKKVILANQLSEVADQFLAGNLAELSTAGAWVGLLAFTLQIYFDFSGYSDMAIGIGRCLGFHFRENFDHPYCCNSITDFWRRWHISLGSFFRDYLYIPLGGNRHHQFLNILIVWFLTGLWHGASWNFVCWGLYFGLIVAIEKFTVLRWKVPAPVAHLYSLILVILGWGIFYFTDFSRMTDFFPVLFGKAVAATDFTVRSALTSRFWLWIAAIVCCLPLGRWIGGWFEKWAIGHNVLHILQTVFAVAVLAVSVALLVGGTSNPFIYTRF
ncbi:MAG: MBOAT family protein [Bacteroidales bacterium]|nr:MBOAT family protein [Bacteroidales bacterium]MBQ1754959.1 MBOAT family protein [Bacteroidales bacterium]MBQ2194961.1 MBOAT family protein [Bacteroidales bacterium]MBQ4221449.1 MBOAT family protein [Bacteroidales bacterium]